MLYLPSQFYFFFHGYAGEHVCMHACVCTCMRVWVHVCLCVHVFVCERERLYAPIHNLGTTNEKRKTRDICLSETNFIHLALLEW